MDPTAKVPFMEYSKRHGFECLGGKQDDITVVAAWVVADESKPSLLLECCWGLLMPGFAPNSHCRKPAAQKPQDSRQDDFNYGKLRRGVKDFTALEVLAFTLSAAAEKPCLCSAQAKDEQESSQAPCLLRGAFVV